MSRQTALIVAVERYQESGINPVKYAEADANGFSEVLEKLGYSRDDQVVLLSSGATKTTIESKLRRLVENLYEDDTFVFFYAGHGFSANDENYITAFDTQRGDLVGTSISLQSVFSRLKCSRCEHVLMFLDSCESGIPPDDKARYIHAALSDTELERFFRESEYCMCFASCKTGQDSYATDKLEHGIWTCHLIKALSGDEPSAIIRGCFVTANSLQNYLSNAVPRTVRESFKDIRVQTPWVYGGKSREFLVADISELLREKARAGEPIEKKLNSIALCGELSQHIRRLSGFRSTHFIPKDIGPAASRFVQDIAVEDIQGEINQVFKGLREQLQYRARDVKATVEHGYGKIICPGFDYEVAVDQDPQNPSQALWRRELFNIRDVAAVLGNAFDSVFSGFFNSIVFSPTGQVEIEELVEKLEDSGIEGLSVECPYDYSYCDIFVREHDWCIHVTGFSVTISNLRHTRPSELVAMFEDTQQVFLSYNIVPILPAGDEQR